jgi:hypothetical protein
MYVDTAIDNRNGKSRKRYLLRTSYRENGKVKKKTIASLCTLKPEEISSLKLALKHKSDLSVLTSIKGADIEQGKSYGAILILNKIAQELGITKALGNSKEAVLAMWQIIGRVLFQGSRLSLIRALEVHEAEKLLSLPSNISAKQLYSNLSWLEENQLKIEKKLVKYNKVEANLYLYDVTSSYLEGINNELAEYGYNRDKKKGKKQIVIGLLTNSKGMPVAVRVFKGNTSDSKTIPEQINLLRNEFLVKKVTLVGDRAMFPKAQKDGLPEEISYITAISKRQIKTLLDNKKLQMSFFDEDLQEVEIDKIRYILRCNNVRKKEVSASRNSKIKLLEDKIEEQNKYLLEHKRANPEIALRDLNSKVTKLNIAKFISLVLKERIIECVINQKALSEESKLDGCYCLTTDVDKKEADKETIHARYKDLAMVERAFRTMKQSHLEIRPVFLRREDRTKAHVFITMLAFMVEKKLAEYWDGIEVSVTEGLSALTTLTINTLSIGKDNIVRPVKPTGISKKLLEKINVKIPRELEKGGYF